MPAIRTQASVTNLPPQKVFELIGDSAVLLQYTQKKTKDFTEPHFKKEIEIFIPSKWSSTGDCLLTVLVQEMPDSVAINVTGEISQFSVSSLTEKIDKLLELTKVKVVEMHGSMEYEKLTRFLPQYKLQFDKRDRTYIVLAVVIAVAWVLPHFILDTNIVSPIGAVFLAILFFLIVRVIISRSRR